MSEMENMKRESRDGTYWHGSVEIGVEICLPILFRVRSSVDTQTVFLA